MPYQDEVIAGYCYLRFHLTSCAATDADFQRIRRSAKTWLQFQPLKSQLTRTRKPTSDVEESGKNVFSHPPMHLAVKNGRWGMFCFLYFVLGATMTAKDKEGHFIIKYDESLKRKATRIGRFFQRLSVVQILKHLDVCVESATEKENLIDLIAESKSYGIRKLNKLDRSLIYGIKTGKDDAVNVLIDLDHDLDVQDPEEANKSVLHHLVEQSKPDLLERVLQVGLIPLLFSPSLNS